MQPLVSVVIPTYNRARDLERAVKSVLAQTFSRWEILIVDNYSSDHTDQLVKDFNDSRIKLIKFRNDGVIAASRNLGVKHASGEYIAFLDSDDWWMPEKLEESLRYLEKGADIVYHDLFLATKPGQKVFWRRARTRALKSPVFGDLISNGNALNTSSVLMRRTVLEEINGLSADRALIASEDYDTWLRAAKITEKFSRVPRVLGYYWTGGGNYWSGGKDGATCRNIIASLEHLESLYADDFDKSKTDSYWLNYVKGKTYYQMGSHGMAGKHLNLIRRLRLPFAMKIRTYWMLLFINMRCSGEQ